MIKFIKSLFSKKEEAVAPYKVETAPVETFPVPKEARAKKKPAAKKAPAAKKPRAPKKPKAE